MLAAAAAGKAAGGPTHSGSGDVTQVLQNPYNVSTVAVSPWKPIKNRHHVPDDAFRGGGGVGGSHSRKNILLAGSVSEAATNTITHSRNEALSREEKRLYGARREPKGQAGRPNGREAGNRRGLPRGEWSSLPSPTSSRNATTTIEAARRSPESSVVVNDTLLPKLVSPEVLPGGDSVYSSSQPSARSVESACRHGNEAVPHASRSGTARGETATSHRPHADSRKQREKRHGDGGGDGVDIRKYDAKYFSQSTDDVLRKYGKGSADSQLHRDDGQYRHGRGQEMAQRPSSRYESSTASPKSGRQQRSATADARKGSSTVVKESLISLVGSGAIHISSRRPSEMASSNRSRNGSSNTGSPLQGRPIPRHRAPVDQQPRKSAAERKSGRTDPSMGSHGSLVWVAPPQPSASEVAPLPRNARGHHRAANQAPSILHSRKAHHSSRHGGGDGDGVDIRKYDAKHFSQSTDDVLRKYGKGSADSQLHRDDGQYRHGRGQEMAQRPSSRYESSTASPKSGRQQRSATADARKDSSTVVKESLISLVGSGAIHISSRRPSEMASSNRSRNSSSSIGSPLQGRPIPRHRAPVDKPWDHQPSQRPRRPQWQSQQQRRRAAEKHTELAALYGVRSPRTAFRRLEWRPRAAVVLRGERRRPARDGGQRGRRGYVISVAEKALMELEEDRYSHVLKRHGFWGEAQQREV